MLEWHAISDGRLTRKVFLEGEVGANSTRSFCPANGLIAAGEDKGMVRVWKARTGELLHTFGVPDFIDGHPTALNVVKLVVISPDGGLLAVGMEGNTQIAVFSLTEGKMLYSRHVRALFTAGDRRVDPGLLACISVSADGRYLASTDSTEPGIRICEARTGREIRQLSGHRDHTRSVAFSPDGKALASTGGDGSLKLWHLPTGREVATLLETGASGPVVFSPNGEYLIAGLADHVRVFRAPPLAEIDRGR
jgi:WD40 repeat protein